MRSRTHVRNISDPPRIRDCHSNANVWSRDSTGFADLSSIIEINRVLTKCEKLKALFLWLVEPPSKPPSSYDLASRMECCPRNGNVTYNSTQHYSHRNGIMQAEGPKNLPAREPVDSRNRLKRLFFLVVSPPNVAFQASFPMMFRDILSMLQKKTY